MTQAVENLIDALVGSILPRAYNYIQTTDPQAPEGSTHLMLVQLDPQTPSEQLTALEGALAGRTAGEMQEQAMYSYMGLFVCSAGCCVRQLCPVPVLGPGLGLVYINCPWRSDNRPYDVSA